MSSLRVFLSPLRLGVSLLAACSLLAPAATAQGATQPDQVLRLNSKGTVVTVTGKVREASLDQVVVEVEGKDRTIDGADVLEVLYGTIPPAMVEARAYWNRGDFVNAAAKYKVAAGDASASTPARARARLRAIESLMKQGAKDASAFDLARAEAETFLGEFATSRDLPKARYLLGRAKRLSGDAAGAAEIWRALAKDSTGDTRLESYPVVQGFRAALGAADALIVAGDTQTAREIFLGLDSQLPRAIANTADALDALELTRFQAKARLGEGFCMLAAGNLPQARTFFQGQRRDAKPADAAQRFGAALGLAEVHLADGKAREAQLLFAEVAALDHTDRDRVGRALVGLAKALLALPDSSSRIDAKTRVEIVLSQYGDTPSVIEAAELLRTF